jgi:uncharacterized protein (TIGR03067 family)
MTRVFQLAALAASLAVPASADDKSDGLAKLKGVWVAESRTFDGKVEAKADLNGLTLTIDGDKFTFTDKEGKTVAAGKLSADATAKPKAVDVAMPGKDGKEMVLKGIYEVDDGTLKTAMPQTPGDRPTEFKAEKGSPVRVTVYKRAEK